VKASPKKAITVRVEQEVWEALRQEAREKGISLATLARLWLSEHIRGKRGKQGQ
jgi:predicted HicB family RNase H-like nuclease